jgi:hypothetical protein
MTGSPELDKFIGFVVSVVALVAWLLIGDFRNNEE